MKTPGCCAFQRQFLGASFIFTVILLLNSQGHNLPIRHHIHQVNPLCTKKTNNDNSCPVFLSSQWRAQRLIDDKSSSKRNSKSSRMPLKLEKRRFIILLVVGDISPEVVLNSFIDFKLKYFTRQVFSLLWQCPYNIDTPTVKEDCGILLWENNTCSLGKQDQHNCQHFIDRGIKHHVFPKKAFCFLFHAVELPLITKGKA